jgi:hypothetical protein
MHQHQTSKTTNRGQGHHCKSSIWGTPHNCVESHYFLTFAHHNPCASHGQRCQRQHHELHACPPPPGPLARACRLSTTGSGDSLLQATWSLASPLDSTTLGVERAAKAVAVYWLLSEGCSGFACCKAAGVYLEGGCGHDASLAPQICPPKFALQGSTDAA